MTKPETMARSKLLQAMTLDGLDELAISINDSLKLADRTADTLRDWLKLVNDEIERKAGF